MKKERWRFRPATDLNHRFTMIAVGVDWKPSVLLSLLHICIHADMN